MEFDNSFEVPLPPAEAWKVLLDIERVAPCMPGAELTEVVGKDTYKGKIGVRLGPVALTFAGIVKFEEIDDAKHTARVSAQGTDAKGRGGANASSVFRLEPAGSGSKVLVHTNLTLSGAVAQYGRGVGIIQATATQIMNQFAKALKEKLGQGQPVVAAAPAAPASAAALPAAQSAPSIVPPSAPPPAKPISGFALMAKVFWSWLTGLFKRS
jgi:carbon monoxide dehydrogenase subunit G